MARAFDRGEMGRRIDPSSLTHRAISRFTLWSTTGVTGVMCYPVCGMMHIKESLLLIGFFLSRYLSGSLPYV